MELTTSNMITPYSTGRNSWGVEYMCWKIGWIGSCWYGQGSVEIFGQLLLEETFWEI